MDFNPSILQFKLTPSPYLGPLPMKFGRTRAEVIHFTVDGPAIFHGTASISDAIMLPRSIFPACSAARYRILHPSQPVASSAVTANILSIGYFKYVDFGIETISSATKSIRLSLHVTLPLSDTILTARGVGCDHDHNHDGVERHDLMHYFLFTTIMQHFVAGVFQLKGPATGAGHPPVTRARPLVASRLDFPAGDGQAGVPCPEIRTHDGAPNLPRTTRQPIRVAAANRHPPKRRAGASFP
jgi:hypothetical protein